MIHYISAKYRIYPRFNGLQHAFNGLQHVYVNIIIYFISNIWLTQIICKAARKDRAGSMSKKHLSQEILLL